MRLALMGQKLGHQVFIVIEQLSEVDVLLEVAEELGVVPTRRRAHQAGQRRRRPLGAERRREEQVRPQLRAAGEARRPAARRRAARHAASSCTSTSAARSRHPLHQGGAAGGGAVLRGAAQHGRRHHATSTSAAGWASTTTGPGRRQSHASVNYSLQEYANDVVYTMAEACRENEVPMPHLIIESGRALTAHHALLLLKVIDVESQAEPTLPAITDDDHALLHEMREDYDLLGGAGAPGAPAATRCGAPGDGGLPRRVVRQGAGAAAVQQRRAAAPRARARGAVSTTRS